MTPVSAWWLSILIRSGLAKESCCHRLKLELELVAAV